MKFGKKKECAICAKTCFEDRMVRQRGKLVCRRCVDKE